MYFLSPYVMIVYQDGPQARPYLRYYGDYSGGDHLFPFRTEKLSPPAQMVLHYNAEEYVVADLF